MGNCWGARATAVNPSLSGAPTSSSAQTSKSKIVSQGSSSAGSSYPTSQNAGDNISHSASGSVRAFTYSDLRAATRNFRQENLLGEGGFGCVYKGWIDEQGFMAARPGTGMVIAVKKLNQDGLQGHKEWLAEVHFLGQLSHPNLVKLIGFCAEDDHRLLAYEFMPRGSLENHLLRTASHNQTLPWHIRMKIAMGAAKGLAFLHDAERAVIYRDFKASNILLDSEYNAKLSDFGLARDGPTGDKTHVTTEVMGTYGYAAPEYVATGHLTAKSDVYSFGVVLLEILTGLRAVDKNRPGGQQNLVDWAKPYLGDKRKLFRLIDSRLDGKYSMKGAHKLTNLVLSCLQTESKMRPQMKEVVEELEPLVGMKYQTKPSNNREHPNGASALLAHQQSPNLSPVHARYRQSPSPSPLHAHNRRSPRAGGEKAGRR